MRKLLIIDTHPYGTLTDVAKWCDNMPKDIKVKVVCLKNIENKPTLPQNVKLLETPFVSSYNIRGALFVLSAIITIIFHKGPILVEYFKGCSIFKKLMPWRRMLLDVRSIKERYGREPVPEDFWEEFPLFVDKSNIADYPTIPIRRQLGDAFDVWLEQHKAPFKNLEEFLAAAKNADK